MMPASNSAQTSDGFSSNPLPRISGCRPLQRGRSGRCRLRSRIAEASGYPLGAQRSVCPACVACASECGVLRQITTHTYSLKTVPPPSTHAFVP